MEIQGIIKLIGETQTYGSNGFRKRELVIVTEEQYPQTLMIEFVQDKCDVLNGYMEGQKVEIGINLKGREWVNPQSVTKYFNTFQGWKINLSDEQPQSQSAVDNYQAQQNNAPEPAADDFEDDDHDDLPF